MSLHSWINKSVLNAMQQKNSWLFEVEKLGFLELFRLEFYVNYFLFFFALQSVVSCKCCGKYKLKSLGFLQAGQASSAQ